MIHRRAALFAAAATLLVVAAACSSSSKPSSSGSTTPTTKSASGSATGTSSGSAAGGTTGSGTTYTLGVLADITGAGSPSSGTLPQGVKAGVGLAAQEGYHIKYVVADAGTSTAGALAAAQKLVDENHVFAVVANSSMTFAAAPFLAAHGIPVVGAAVDATEWIADRNKFSIIGTEDFTKVFTQFGLILKDLGVTNMATIGYGISPSSSATAKGSALSAQDAGIKVGYLNANFPFGGTDVGPTALAIKSAGSNGLISPIIQNTEFALVQALRQDGVDLKGVLNSTGYGADLLSGGPGALQIAQGQYFLTAYEPMEMNTAATQKAASAFKTYAGISGDPTFAEYQGYLSVAAFVQGLQAAGAHPTQAQFINAMLGINDFNAEGLFGTHELSFSMAARGQTSGVDNCEWITKYSGSTFDLVTGMDPICGHTVPGQKVS
jgi:branched-chain amino acid transport system substrate-binding protein